jgi:hypothetical protein
MIADDALFACRALGLRHEPDTRRPDGLWTANCPLCILTSERALLIREHPRGAHVTVHCKSGCRPTEIIRHLERATEDEVSTAVETCDALPFVSAAELRASAPDEPEWLWQGYLAPQALTLLAAKPKADGAIREYGSRNGHDYRPRMCRSVRTGLQTLGV